MVDSSWGSGDENLQLRTEDRGRFLQAKARNGTTNSQQVPHMQKYCRPWLAQEIGPGLM